MTVLDIDDEKTETNAKHGYYFKCQCECGNIVTVTRNALIMGTTISCGCYNRERSTKHGMEGTRFYKIWIHMKTRCYNPNYNSYNDYGGRGITICDRWL